VVKKEWSVDRVADDGATHCITTIADASLKANTFYTLLLQVSRPRFFWSDLLKTTIAATDRCAATGAAST
jgi:hypothetical protein